MEQPTILTDAEMYRLNEIRRTHEHPVKNTERYNQIAAAMADNGEG